LHVLRSRVKLLHVLRSRVNLLMLKEKNKVDIDTLIDFNTHIVPKPY
jgi:predicted XRE-type DNA-binding protein